MLWFVDFMAWNVPSLPIAMTNFAPSKMWRKTIFNQYLSVHNVLKGSVRNCNQQTDILCQNIYLKLFILFLLYDGREIAKFDEMV